MWFIIPCSNLQGKVGKWNTHVKNNPSLTLEASIWFNSKIRIAKKPFCWYQWAKVSILHLGDKGHMVTFEHLKQHYSLTNTDFWKYIQLRHCLLSVMSSGPVQNTEVQRMLHHASLKKGGASLFYNYIRDSNAPKLNGLKLVWEKDIGEWNSGRKSYLAGTQLLEKSRHNTQVIKSSIEPTGPQAKWPDSNEEIIIYVGAAIMKLEQWCICCMSMLWLGTCGVNKDTC